jgi:hypothetical protein
VHRGLAEVAVDTLFSACELTSKAELVSSSSMELSSKSHASIGSRLNSWGKLGNIDAAFVHLFNHLHDLGPRFRYDSNFSNDTASVRGRSAAR